MTYLQPAVYFISFSVTVCVLFVVIIGNLLEKKKVFSSIVLLFISSIFGIFSLWLRDIAQDVTYNNLFLTIMYLTAEIFSYILISLGYLNPLLQSILPRKKVFFLLLLWNVLLVFFRLNYFFYGHGLLVSFYFRIHFLVLFLFPMFFMFKGRWRNIPIWFKYPFGYPIISLVLLSASIQEVLKPEKNSNPDIIFRVFQLSLIVVVVLLILYVDFKNIRTFLHLKTLKPIDSFNFTKREKEIVELLEEVLTYQEISDKLNVSIKTINTHVYNIYKKCKVKSRSELIKLFSS